MFYNNFIISLVVKLLEIVLGQKKLRSEEHTSELQSP